MRKGKKKRKEKMWHLSGSIPFVWEVQRRECKQTNSSEKSAKNTACVDDKKEEWRQTRKTGKTGTENSHVQRKSTHNVMPKTGERYWFHSMHLETFLVFSCNVLVFSCTRSIMYLWLWRRYLTISLRVLLRSFIHSISKRLKQKDRKFYTDTQIDTYCQVGGTCLKRRFLSLSHKLLSSTEKGWHSHVNQVK